MSHYRALADHPTDFLLQAARGLSLSDQDILDVLSRLDDYSPHNPIEDAHDFFAFIVSSLASGISPADTENNIQQIHDELIDLFQAFPLTSSSTPSSDHFGM